MNETDNEFIIRVIRQKDKFCLTWNDICDIINSETNKNLSADSYRKKYSKYKYQNTDSEDAENLDLIDQFKFQKFKLADERRQINSLYRTISREDTLKEIAHDAILNLTDLDFKPIPSKLIKSSISEATLLISDWHYGIEIDNIWNKYDIDIAVKRINALRDEVIRQCKINNFSKLHIVNLGDMIAGNIHLPLRLNSQIDVITQILQVSKLISKFIYDISTVVDINYYSVIDNHSRIDPNKKESIQLESLCRITDWFIAEKFEDFDNVNICLDNNLSPDMTRFKMGNNTILAVHGDKDKPNQILTKLPLYTKGDLDIIVSAHLHHFSINENDLITNISNGSLMGTDQFAADLRLNSQPSQTLFYFDNGNLVVNKINL